MPPRRAALAFAACVCLSCGHFVELSSVRCLELQGQLPIGDVGVKWSDELERDARDICDGENLCAGYMRYTGDDERNCIEWCGRPQFCAFAANEVDDDPTPPLVGNPSWTSYVKAEYLKALGVTPMDLYAMLPGYQRPKTPLEDEPRTLNCSDFGSSPLESRVSLIPGDATELPPGADCYVAFQAAGQSRTQLPVQGILSEVEDPLLPVFSASVPDQDFAPGTALPGEPRRFFFDAIPEFPTTVAYRKKYTLSVYFLSQDSYCAGPNGTRLFAESVKEDMLAQHVYVEDGTHETRMAAFKHYHFTMLCGDFSEHPFPPLALIYSLAYVAHAMVPEHIHWKASRMFFHLPDAAQGVRSTKVLGLEAYLEHLMVAKSKEKIMEFKETFTLLMQVLFRYRYAEPVPRRAEVAACGLCDAEARLQRRAKAEDPDEAVAVVFCVMSRRSAHELRQVLRDTWGRSLVEKAPAVVQRFFVGTAANASHQLHDLDKGDVVELPVVESYRTLNLKALVMLSWAEKRYPNLQWLVRHDDDVYLRAPALLAQLASRPPVRYLWGMIDHGSSPVRDPEHQHYNSYEQFPKQDHPSWGDIFPPYARGLLWAMSADLVAAIVEAFNADVEELRLERAGEILGEAAANTVPHPDDPAVGVLIAGLVQGGMSINLDDRDFNSFSLNPSCNSTFSNIHNRTWVVHHVQPETMRCMWELDTAEAAQGIASQNSATDASNRIFPDLCLCSTEVVEEEDGEEEPFWYDRPVSDGKAGERQFLGRGLAQEARGATEVAAEVHQRGAAVAAGGSTRARRTESDHWCRASSRRSRVRFAAPTEPESRKPLTASTQTQRGAKDPGRSAHRANRGSEALTSLWWRKATDKNTPGPPGVASRGALSGEPARGPAAAAACSTLPAGSRGNLVLEHIFARAELNTEAAAGDRGGESELGKLGVGFTGRWSAGLRELGSSKDEQPERFATKTAEAYPAGGWDNRTLAFFWGSEVRQGTSCPTVFDDFPQGVIKRHVEETTRARAPRRRSTSPPNLAAMSSQPRASSSETRESSRSSCRSLIFNLQDAQQAVLRATAESTALPLKEETQVPVENAENTDAVSA
eukprot:s1295_g3.t2